MIFMNQTTQFQFKFKQRAEFSKVLRGIDRVRIRSKKFYIKELNELKRTNPDEFFMKFSAYESCESLEELNRTNWITEMESSDELINIYVNEEYIASRYSTSELAYFVEIAASKTDYIYNKNFIKIFENEVSYHRKYLLRKAVVPVNFSLDLFNSFSIAVPTEDFPEIINLSDKFMLISSIKDERCFKSKGIDLHDVDKSQFIHYEKTSGNSLTASPLLVFDIEASSDRERDRAKEKFIWFRIILDYFILYNELNAVTLSDNSHPTKKHFFSIRNVNLMRFPLDFDNSFKLEFKYSDFQKILDDNLFPYLLDIYDKNSCAVRNKIFNALHFFSKAYRENDNIDKFLSYIISIESICSVTDIDIGKNLCTFIDGEIYKNFDSQKLVKEMRNAYSLRSKIVHHGVSYVSGYDTKLAKILALISIRKALRMYKELSINHEEVIWVDWVKKIADKE